MGVTTFAHGIILAVLLPAWLVLGLLDWRCHRAANIETTAGPWESILHLMLSGQAAIELLRGIGAQISKKPAMRSSYEKLFPLPPRLLTHATRVKHTPWL
jgi:hypothetical protein